MDDFQGPCEIFQGGGQFGNQLAPVGDVDNSGTVDFLVGHRLCDSTISRRSEELLLYKGVNGGLPSSNNGLRIGPTERNSITAIVAAGDWDGDHHIDIAVRIQILDDTSEHNVDGYDIARLVVFWGNDSGQYSLSDTSQLSCDAPMWLGIPHGLAADLTGDGVDDLLVSSSSGFSNGHLAPCAGMLLFSGHHQQRWGREGTARTASWRWWNGPYLTGQMLDQDSDGATDIVFYNNDGNRASLSVLYGKPGGGFPDTADIQTVEIAKKAGTGFSLFTDVTGDRVPDLLCCSGVADVVKVYVGFKGQRLLEQFGSGNDSANAGSEKWWGRPWATIWLPRKINSNWFGNDDQLFDLGDANLDGVGDIYVFSWPYIMEYNGGSNMDSLADALINITPGTEIGILKRLGNIDGSGRDIIALTTGNEIRFYAPTKDISSIGRNRRLPPGTGKKPGAVRSVTGEDRLLVLDAIPNPSRDEIRFSWRGGELHGPVTITIYDVSGREVDGCDGRAEDGAAHYIVPDLSAGTYLAQLRCGAHVTSTTIVIR